MTICAELFPLAIDFAAVALDWGTATALYAVSDDCYHCHPQLVATAGDCLALQSRFPTRLEAVLVDGSVVDATYHFGEHGQYVLSVDSLDVTVEAQPVHSFTALWVALAVLVALALGYELLMTAMRASQREREAAQDPAEYQAFAAGESEAQVQHEPQADGEKKKKKKKQRLNSLDTFRGIALGVMIFVNSGGGQYWFLDHSAWNGLTVADLVFPWFCWIMGVSMTFSVSSQYRRGASLKEALKAVLIRGAKLLAIGLFLAKAYKLSHWRLPGVLQYFAVSYTVAGCTELLTQWTFQMDDVTGYAKLRVEPPTQGPLRDVLPFWRGWAVACAVLATYLGITFGLPVPGCPTGYIGPGGIGDWGEHPTCTGGAHRYVDLQVFGDSHLYHHPTCLEPYECDTPYDPEGLVGVLTCCFMVMLGNQTGRMLQLFTEHRDRLLRFAAWGFALCLLAGALCGFSRDGGPIPVNKNLWSPSFVLLLAGFANLALAGCYVLVDLKGWWSGAPFRVVGMNSIVLYCGSEILFGYFPFAYNSGDSHAAKLVENLVGVSCWFLWAFYLHSKGIYISV